MANGRPRSWHLVGVMAWPTGCLLPLSLSALQNPMKLADYICAHGAKMGMWQAPDATGCSLHHPGLKALLRSAIYNALRRRFKLRVQVTWHSWLSGTLVLGRTCQLCRTNAAMQRRPEPDLQKQICRVFGTGATIGRRLLPLRNSYEIQAFSGPSPTSSDHPRAIIKDGPLFWNPTGFCAYSSLQERTWNMTLHNMTIEYL